MLVVVLCRVSFAIIVVVMVVVVNITCLETRTFEHEHSGLIVLLPTS